VNFTFIYLQNVYILGFTKGKKVCLQIEILYLFYQKLYVRLSGFSLYARHILNRKQGARRLRCEMSAVLSKKATGYVKIKGWIFSEITALQVTQHILLKKKHKENISVSYRFVKVT